MSEKVVLQSLKSGFKSGCRRWMRSLLGGEAKYLYLSPEARVSHNFRHFRIFCGAASFFLRAASSRTRHGNAGDLSALETRRACYHSSLFSLAAFSRPIMRSYRQLLFSEWLPLKLSRAASSKSCLSFCVLVSSRS
jgi:hypothetical protein